WFASETSQTRRAGCDRYASGPNESRRRDLVGDCRRQPVVDSGPGDERRRGAHGGAVPACRRQFRERRRSFSCKKTKTRTQGASAMKLLIANGYVIDPAQQ